MVEREGEHSRKGAKYAKQESDQILILRRCAAEIIFMAYPCELTVRVTEPREDHLAEHAETPEEEKTGKKG